MESSGECRGCQRNIKFAVKQARLCRTCYNKTYLTSQKRREYYKNKKKRREQHSTMPVEPAINVHHHRHAIKAIKKEATGGSRMSPSSSPLRSDNPLCHEDPVAAHLYMLSYQSQSVSHTQSSCSDCVPREGASPAPSGAALSLAALAHASQHHALASSSLPALPTTAGSMGPLHHHLSSSMPSSPSSSPSFSVQPAHQRSMGCASPPTASATTSLALPSGSPPTATVLLHDLLQQVATSYPAYYYATLAAAAVMPTEMFAPTATSPQGDLPSSSAALPSLSSFLLPSPKGATDSSLRYSAPAPSKATSQVRLCQQCLAPVVVIDGGKGTTCDACLVASNRRSGEQAATRSPAIKNLLN